MTGRPGNPLLPSHARPVVAASGSVGRRRWLAAVLLGVLGWSGCQTAQEPGPGIGRFAVKTDRAPFFKYGPAQATGPDATLAVGTKLSVFQRSMGFAQVVLDDGRSGFVAASDLAPVAAPEPEAAPAKRQRPEPRPEPVPDLDSSELPLPMTEPLGLPEEAPSADQQVPGFRY